MISAIFLVIFFGGLTFYGWQTARFVLKTSRIELLLPLSLIIGYCVYTFFLNIFSYLIPIELNFYIILFFLLVIAFSLFFLNKPRPKLRSDLSKKESSVIFLTVFIIMVLSSFLVSRSIGADDLAYPHLPAAASIAGGNFPPKNLNLPDYDLVMHYGPHLFFAAISRISGFSIFFVFRLCVFLFSGAILLLIFNTAKLFIKNNKSSFLVALVGMFGGGFRFIYGFEGLITLYRRFFLGWDIEHPFELFGYMWKTQPLTSSLVGSFSMSSWAALYWSLILVIIYLFLRNIGKERSFWYDFLLIVLLSVLALNNEIAFISLGFGLLAAPFILYFRDKDKERSKPLLKHALIVFIVTSLIVLFQGGTITAILKNIIQNRSSQGYGVGLGFSFFKYPFSFDIGKEVFPFYGLKFILCFGLVYFLIVPASVFIGRRYFKKSIFLLVVSFFSFLVPLVISFDNWVWQGTLSHFFRVSSLIWAILVGLFLVMILLGLDKKSACKKIIYLSLIIICLDGFLLVLTRPLYKKSEPRLDNDSFFAKLTTPTKIELESYRWARKNSHIEDYFLVFANKDDIDNQPNVFENFRFVMFSQRLAPVYTHNNNHLNPILPDDKYYTAIYKRLIIDCSSGDMSRLNYRYLYVNKNWPDGLEEKCLANNSSELKFEFQENDQFVRIHKVLN